MHELFDTPSYVKIKPPDNLTFRPIVAGPTCETHRLINLLDILLQPYTKYVKSYIKDTQDFLQRLPEQVVEESILVLFDVVNLYSNIPHDLGIEAISFWLNKYPKELPNRISKEFVLDGIKLILENNSYKIYATLVLAYLEEKLYEQVEKEFDSNFRKYIEVL